jgi:hypothetical protein
MEKLAAAIPRPRANQLIYAGVLGPNASLRKEVVAFGREVLPVGGEGDAVSVEQKDEGSDDGQSDSDVANGAGDHPARRRKSYTWAELMARVYLFDVLECPRCQGRMKIIATIWDRSVIRKILAHLGLPALAPTPAPARSRQAEFEEIVYELDCL